MWDKALRDEEGRRLREVGHLKVKIREEDPEGFRKAEKRLTMQEGEVLDEAFAEWNIQWELPDTMWCSDYPDFEYTLKQEGIAYGAEHVVWIREVLVKINEVQKLSKWGKDYTKLPSYDLNELAGMMRYVVGLEGLLSRVEDDGELAKMVGVLRESRLFHRDTLLDWVKKVLELARKSAAWLDKLPDRMEWAIDDVALEDAMSAMDAERDWHLNKFMWNYGTQLDDNAAHNNRSVAAWWARWPGERWCYTSVAWRYAPGLSSKKWVLSYLKYLKAAIAAWDPSRKLNKRVLKALEEDYHHTMGFHPPFLENQERIHALLKGKMAEMVQRLESLGWKVDKWKVGHEGGVAA